MLSLYWREWTALAVKLDGHLGGNPPTTRTRSKEKPVVIGYTTGVFDMFHVGHLRILERARAHCDRLIVGVTTDELSFANKGKSPIIPYAERVEIIEALRCVDEVVPQDSSDKMSAWERWPFERMFVGDDWRGTETWNRLDREFAAVGVEIVYFPYTSHTSSTMLRSALETIHGEER
jgi:glycerol-3-phosphate cytidylyltransferase